jgi:hypothetical protein
MAVGGYGHAPAALSPAETQYPLRRRQGVPQDRSGRLRKISRPRGFDTRTVQLVASRYTDRAIPAHSNQISRDFNYVTFWISISLTDI